MTTANYAACLAITLDFEGGYSNDPGDPGGPTKYGITIFDVRKYIKPNATAQDVKNLTLDQAKVIYQKHYWEPVAGDDWREGLDLSVFDAGVNSGLGRALPWAQYALNANGASFKSLAMLARNLTTDAAVAAVKKYNAKRLSFLHALRTWRLFGRGWGRRVAAIESLGVKMVLKAANLAAPVVAAKLMDESAHATKEQKASINKTVGAAGGSSAVATGGTQVDWLHANWSSYLLAAIVIGFAVLLLIHFIRQAHNNHERALAYAQAAAQP